MARRNLGLWLIFGGLAALILLNGPWVDGASEWTYGHWYAANHGKTWQCSGVGLPPSPEDAR